MRVLVTGGSGFIGTHLCRLLLAMGHEVSVLDLKPPEKPLHGAHYQIGDVRNPADVSKAIEGVDAVYHFAALVSVPYCQEHPVEGYETNLLGTLVVLDEIRKTGRPIRILFASSAACYGRLGKAYEPISESVVDEPISLYGAQKLGSEHAIRLYHQAHKIPAVVFRFFNVYGPGQDPTSPYSGVISIFSRSLKTGAPLRLNGGGTQTRDFVSVYDLVRGCASALELPESQCDGQAINLGSGKQASIRGLAELMSAISGGGKLQDALAREGDVEHSLADISRATQLLGFKPSVDIWSGIKELLS